MLRPPSVLGVRSFTVNAFMLPFPVGDRRGPEDGAGGLLGIQGT